MVGIIILGLGKQRRIQRIQRIPGTTTPIPDIRSKIKNRSYFRSNNLGAIRITIVNDKTMLVRTLFAGGESNHYVQYLTASGGRWPHIIVEDSLRDESGNSITDPSKYLNLPDSFDHRETLVVRFDAEHRAIGWEEHEN